VTEPSVNILLADDHPMIRTAVESLLRDSGYRLIATVGTGGEVASHPALADADIVLLDLQMPGGSGMSALRELRGRGDKRPVVLLTAAIDDEALVEAASLNVEGIVLKNSDPAFLLDCLERVRSGGTWIDSELKKRSRALRERRSAAPPRPSLTPREKELIGLVRQGLRNREIAGRIGVTEGTVKVYLHALYEKVGVANRTELAMRADAGQ
jgi:two-component system nitrate/nitrite response regulator NarP